MAGDSDKTKQVFFIGAWRTQQVTDQLLRQISSQIGSKKRVLTKLNISAEGLELLILNSKGQVTRKDKIALENIVDFIDNKYSTTCTLAIVRDKQRRLYTVFVFQCKSDRDAAALIHNFKTTKRQLSGEGYNTNLTPKGKNWTLQQKSEQISHPALNGDVRGPTVFALPSTDVRVLNTEKQNGGVTIFNSSNRHDSISRESVRTTNSEVKEELHHLADEVRDIKRLLQGSQGRVQFENPHNYRIIQGLPVADIQRQTEYIERDINKRPVNVRRDNIYVKNEGNARFIESGPQIIRVNGRVPRSTRRFRTNGHFVTATSPTRADYTKRVYESTSPFHESGQRIQPVKIMTRNQPVLVPRTRIYQSQSSDIVQKNIEDVYRSRSLRKMYLPPSPNGNTVDYVNSQMIQHARQVPPQTSVSKETEQPTVHVKYNPEVRTYYETTTAIAPEESNSSNISTNVHTYEDVNINDNFRQSEDSVEVQQNESIINREDNVIVVRTAAGNPRSSTEEINKHVVYVGDNNDVQRNEHNVIGGNVYHVRAEFAEDYEDVMARDENMTIIEADHKEVKGENIRIIENTNNVQTVQRTVSFDDNVNAVDDEQEENTGLFGAYTKKPEEYDEPRNEVVEESAYRYHEDELYIEESQNEELHSEKEDGGLFGAYTKKPEEYGELEHEVVDETAYRYHENELDTEANEDDQSEQIDIKNPLESLEEKRVRYNETVEQIPLEDHESEHIIENVQNADVYTVETHQDEGQGEQFRNELSAVVSKLRHNYDEKIKEDSGYVKKKEDDKKYKFDMNALKAYSAEPDIIIVDAKNEKTAETKTFRNKMPVPVVGFLNVDQAKETILDKGDGLVKSKSAISEEIQSGTDRLVSTKNEILENKLPIPGESLDFDGAKTAIIDKGDSLVKAKSDITEEIQNGADQLVSTKDDILGNKLPVSGESLDFDGAKTAILDKGESLVKAKSDITEEIQNGADRLISTKDDILGNKLPVSGESIDFDGAKTAILDKGDSLVKAKSDITEEIQNGADRLISTKDDILGNKLPVSGESFNLDEAKTAILDTGESLEKTKSDITENIQNGADRLVSAKDDILGNKLPVSGESLNFDGAKKAILEKGDSLFKAKSEITEKIQNGADRLVDTKDEFFAFASKTEGSVLF